MTTAPQEADFSKEPLRLVLFGLPASGKSSLLGALHQVSSTYPEALAGEIVDASQRFQVLAEREPPTLTPVEVVPYLVEYIPTAAAPVPILLIDCDGVAVLGLLKQPNTAVTGPDDRALAREVLKADVLLLVIDASASVKQLETDFTQFAQFLEIVERIRGARTEVGGLPVFLVLNKVDKLVQPGLSREQWHKKVESHQRYIAERFEAFLRRTETERERSFGLIDLHPAATATSPLPFADANAEPYGVGALFQQAFQQAVQYRERRKVARRRLIWTIGLTCGVIGLLVGLLIALILFPPSGYAPVPLNLNLPFGKLEERLAELEEKSRSAEFARLPAAERDEVLARIQELKDYIAYYRDVASVGAPKSIDKQADLESAKRELQLRLVPRLGWTRTLAAELRLERMSQIEALLEAAREARLWFQRTGERVASLRALGGEKHRTGVVWDLFLEDYERLLPQTVVPFVPDKPLLKGMEEPTWAHVLKIDTVNRVSAAFEKNLRELIQVRHVAAALRFTPPRPETPPVLEIPSGLSLDQVAERARALRTAYPEYLREFKVPELPDAMRQQTIRTAALRYRYLLAPGRAEVLRQLRERGGDTEKGWAGVRQWLDDPQELADWHTLVGALHGLRLPRPVDPVAQLADFLDRKSFALRFSLVEVSLPLTLELLQADADKMTLDKVTLEITQRRTGNVVATGAFKLRDVYKDAGAGRLRISFRSTGAELLTFLPGDDLTATLTLPKNKVVWAAGNRSARFAFERLSLTPRLDGESEDGITFRVLVPEDGLPEVPDLLPEVVR